MKSLLICLFLLISFVGYSQLDSPKIKDIKRLLIVSGAANAAKAGVESMANSMKAQSDQNNLPEGFWDEFIKAINYDELAAMYIPIYDKHYSHQEIIDMIKFYESPTGKKMVEKTPLIVAESMEAGREWGGKLGEKVYEKMTKKN
ncbi:DUF2059 domain-containing protein [Emticicia sp. BO119]|uniref:DUF2059 domain-containing protein n=1 Tax=Emticicia sp. BO119 TaxID=2757768 RepID=UPI0015F1022D|nr:DUF2059 domain-containing protein [Emticicia sp. BO119]MBA4850014.1 DUF2059 domain-containing protein [Emticicia sp. BO119]